MPTPYPVVGASIALAGADKVLGGRAYEGLFQHLGWSDGEMRAVGAAEVLGGLLMISRPTRGVGAVLVLAASAAVLVAELRKGDVRLAASRGGVLLAALGALVAPGRRRDRSVRSAGAKAARQARGRR